MMKKFKKIGLFVLIMAIMLQITPIAALAEAIEQPAKEETIIVDSSEQIEQPNKEESEATDLAEQQKPTEISALEKKERPILEEQDSTEPYINPSQVNKELAAISDNIFTGVQLADVNGTSLEGKRIEYGIGVVIKLAFNFDNKNYKNGEEFKFTMPDAFNFGTKNISGNFTNGLAKWDLDVTTRELKITFLADQHDGQYDIQLNTALKTAITSLGDATKQQVVFPTKNQDTTFNLEFKPVSNGTKISSSLSPSQVNPDKVIVNAQFNLTKEVDNVGSLLLKDTVNNNVGVEPTIIDKGSIVVYAREVNGRGGLIGTKETLVEGVDYTLVTTDTSIEVRLTNGLDGKGYQLTYEKKIKKPNDKLTTITTEAQTSRNVGMLSKDTSTLYPKMFFQKPLTKLSTYNSESKTITWTIAVNYDQTTLSKDALLKDVLYDNNVEYIQDSLEIKEVTFSPSDGSTIIGKDASADWKIINLAANGSFDMTYQKENVAKSYQIKYQTKITDFATRRIINSVQLDGGEAAEASQYIQPDMLYKESGNIDYMKNEMNWSISANRDMVQVKEMHIEDEFSTGVKELLKYQVYAHNGNQKTLLEEGVDYTLTKGLSDLNGQKREGFLIQLIGPYSTTDKKITVEITVKIDLSDINEVNKVIVNKARIWYYDKYDIYKIYKTEGQALPAPGISNNGSKYGQYNAATGKMDWVVSLNAGSMSYDKLIFDDPIVGKHTLIKDSVRFREVMTSDELFDPKSVINSMDHLLTEEDENYPTNMKLDKDNLYLEFAQIKNKRVFVLYSTELDEKWLNFEMFSNTASVSNDGADGKEYRASVYASILNKPIEKSGKINKNADNMIDWTANVTSATPERVIKDLKLVETLDVGQTGAKFVSNSVKVTNSETGEIVSPDKYHISIEANVMTIQFDDYTMTAPHDITYNTVSEVSGAVKSNSEVISDSFGALSDNPYYRLKQAIAYPSFTSGSGTGLVSLGNVTIIKVDEENQSKKLAGATFRLDSVIDDTSIKGTTNDEGVINFENILTGDYRLFEEAAPEGYEIQEDYKTGKLVTVTKNKLDNTFTIANKQKLVNGEMKLTKKASHNGELLAGAVFEIRDMSNQVVGEPLVTDQQGEITASLPPGDYQLIEIKAPKGYKLNATPQAFTIVKNQVEAIKLTFNNDIELGDVLLTKTDKDTGVKLTGAVFELQNTKGKALQTDLTTDKDGKLLVKDLLPGDYQLVETKAPKGYQLDATPQTFTIIENQVDLVNLEFTNTIELGDVELTKTDKDTGETLAGAVFELQDSKGNTLQTDLATEKDGKLLVKNLRPGDYQLVETSAPTGYILDQTPVLVSIQLDQAEISKVTKTNEKEEIPVELPKEDSKENPKEDLKEETKETKDHSIESSILNEQSGELAEEKENKAPNRKELPLTGEQISYISMGIGFLFIASALILFIIKKRKNKEQQ